MYRARSLAGPWEWMGNPCTGVNGANMLGADKTWGGQSTFIFHDEKTGRDVACFDIWNPKNAIDGRYVWLPITWHGDGLPEIPWRIVGTDVAAVLCTVFAFCFAASFLPAWLAARLDPVKAINQE